MAKVLNGVDQRDAYHPAKEVEDHVHSYERWMETAATPSGETHVADEIGSGGGAFQADAGNDDWGSWLQILGSSDTPIVAGNTKYDLHELEIEAAERNETYFIQLAYGSSGATALASGDYTETMFHPVSNQADSTPIIVQMERADSGTKAWIRTKCPGQNTATFDFYIGLHEYTS
jgi:hypothetical protein